MKDQEKFEYLLDDDEFARVMALRYAKDGKPHDDLVEKRIWKRLHTNKARWIYPLSILAAVALLLIFVRPSVKDEDTQPQVKTGVQQLDLSVEWVGPPAESRIKVQTLQPRFVVIYASDAQGERQRVQETFQLQAQEERVLSLDAGQVWQRVCALTAETPAELERLEAMLDLIWTQMGERQCVTR